MVSTLDHRGGTERQRHDRHRGVLDRGELRARGRGQLGEEPRGGCRGGGENDPVRSQQLVVASRPDEELEAGLHPSEPPHGRPGPDHEATGRRQSVGQPAQAAGDSGEHRDLAVVEPVVEPVVAPVVGMAEAWPSTEPRSARRTSCGTVARADSSPGVPGVHPAEQWLDQPVRHLVAEPPGDELADRDVAVDLLRPEGQLVSDPGQSGLREHAGRGQLVQVQGHPHQRPWHRPERAAGPDPRRGDGRVDDVHADRTRQVDALGAAVEYCLRTDVDGQAAHLVQAELAADLGRPLDQEHVLGRVLREEVRGGEAGDASADDDGSAAGHPAPDESRVGEEDTPASVVGASEATLRSRPERFGSPGRPSAVTNSGTNSRVRRLAASTLLATLAVVFTACSSSDDAGGASGGDALEGDVPAAAPAKSGDTAKRARSAVQTRAVIATGSVTLRGKDVQAARDEVESIVTAHGGTIDDERSTSDDDGELRTTRLVLRFPSADFTATFDELKQVAELQSATSKSEDVTTQVINNGIRVRAQARSIQRIEQLLDRAQSIRDIMAIEAQLTRRQAALDSLESQQAWLSDQTSQATITVEINRTDVPVAEETDRGFLAGLSAGWNGLKATTVGVLTATGALLPFAVVLAVLGPPVWLLARRLVRRSSGRTDLGEPAAVDEQG